MKKVNTVTTKIPFKLQLKAVFSDKYMWIIFTYFLIYTIGSTLKNTSLVYYCNYVLGTYNDGITQTLISVLGGIPMGIGIFLVWPLAKKFGKRNLTVAGFVIYAIGGAICYLQPQNMVLVLIGQFIKNIGGLPCAYVIMALFADTLDHEEWKNGFRVDGLAMSIFSVITVAMVGICIGIFNGLIANAGYVAPIISDVAPADGATNFIYNGITYLINGKPSANMDGTFSIAVFQSDSVNQVITFLFVGLEIITAIILIAVLSFLPVEKTISRKQAVIRERQKEECLARNEEWIEPEIRQKQEQEAMDKEAEKASLIELEKKCKAKGLNFEDEKAKSLANKQAKMEALEAKQKVSLEKQKAKEEKTKAKLEAKLAKMTAEHKAKYEAKIAKKAEKLENLWKKKRRSYSSLQ